MSRARQQATVHVVADDVDQAVEDLQRDWAARTPAPLGHRHRHPRNQRPPRRTLPRRRRRPPRQSATSPPDRRDATPAGTCPPPKPLPRRPSSGIVCNTPTTSWSRSNRPSDPSTTPSSPPPPTPSAPPGIAVPSPNGPPPPPASTGGAAAAGSAKPPPAEPPNTTPPTPGPPSPNPAAGTSPIEIHQLEETLRSLPAQPGRDRLAELDPSLEQLVRTVLEETGRHTPQPLDLGRSLPHSQRPNDTPDLGLEL